MVEIVKNVFFDKCDIGKSANKEVAFLALHLYPSSWIPACAGKTRTTPIVIPGEQGETRNPVLISWMPAGVYPECNGVESKGWHDELLSLGLQPFDLGSRQVFPIRGRGKI
jgi:hypothetical protein